MGGAKGATIRAATVEDAPAMGGVHVACWRETYEGLLPASALETLSVQARVAMWERILSEPGSSTKVFLAERKGDVAALASCGRRDGDELAGKGYDGEVTAIYVLKSAQCSGIGYKLMRTMVSALSGLGCTGMKLWVLRENDPARRFYEKLGGQVIGEKIDRRAFGDIVQVAYGWPDLRSVLGEQR
jgi:ribosomal protein S18 acetylase RimI-like enzyme